MGTPRLRGSVPSCSCPHQEVLSLKPWDKWWRCLFNKLDLASRFSQQPPVPTYYRVWLAYPPTPCGLSQMFQPLAMPSLHLQLTFSTIPRTITSFLLICSFFIQEAAELGVKPKKMKLHTLLSHFHSPLPPFTAISVLLLPAFPSLGFSQDKEI